MIHSASMLKPMCMMLAWAKPEVSSCHQAPSLKPGSQVPWPARQTCAVTSNAWSPDRHSARGRSANRSTSRLPTPPVTMIASQTAALSAISTIEVSAALPGLRPPYAVRPLRVVFAPSATHVGQWKPTAASRMQSGQIARSQRWHLMYDSRPGCR